MNKSIQGNANGIVDQAKQTVADVAADTKAGVTTQLEHRIDQAKEIGIEKIETVSDALRGAGEKLEGTGPLPQLAEKAAEGIENLAHFIENKSIGDVFHGIEDFARKQPALFLGGAVALGILAGRFLKSSARHSADADVVGGGDDYETYGFEGSYGSEGDFASDDMLSADDLEDDWDTAESTSSEPMAFQSESSSGTSQWGRTTQPQGSSFGGAEVGSTKGNTEKMPVTQGTIGDTKSDDFGNKSGR